MPSVAAQPQRRADSSLKRASDGKPPSLMIQAKDALRSCGAAKEGVTLTWSELRMASQAPQRRSSEGVQKLQSSLKPNSRFSATEASSIRVSVGSGVGPRQTSCSLRVVPNSDRRFVYILRSINNPSESNHADARPRLRRSSRGAWSRSIGGQIQSERSDTSPLYRCFAKSYARSAAGRSSGLIPRDFCDQH